MKLSRENGNTIRPMAFKRRHMHIGFSGPLDT